MEDCLDQSVGDLVYELQRTMNKFHWKMELRKLQRMVEECRRKMGESSGRFESTSAEIKSEIRREQQLISHSSSPGKLTSNSTTTSENPSATQTPQIHTKLKT
jgi:hypothetical protein